MTYSTPQERIMLRDVVRIIERLNQYDLYEYFVELSDGRLVRLGDGPEAEIHAFEIMNRTGKWGRFKGQGLRDERIY